MNFEVGTSCKLAPAEGNWTQAASLRQWRGIGHKLQACASGELGGLNIEHLAFIIISYLCCKILNDYENLYNGVSLLVGTLYFS